MAYDKNTHHGYADQNSFWEMPISDIAALTGEEESTQVAGVGENRRFAHLMYQVNPSTLSLSGDVVVDTSTLDAINADGFATLSAINSDGFETLSGQLAAPTPTTFYHDAVAQGLISGQQSFIIGAHNPSLATGVTEDVWDEGGTLSFLSGAETMDIASTDTDDIFIVSH